MPFALQLIFGILNSKAMKKLLLFILVSLLLISCEVEGEFTRDGQSAQIITPASVLKYNGNFSSTSGITVSGSAKIYLDDNRYKVHLDDFNISDGPDLKVYLSKTATPNEFVNLGNLTDSRIYIIPAGVNVSQYPFVLIHCQQYNHLFAIAPLTEN
jgi:hypothetical protein